MLLRLTCLLHVGAAALCLSSCSKMLQHGPGAGIFIPVDSAFYTATTNDTSSPNGEILLALNSKTDGKLLFLDHKGMLVREKSVGTDVENLQKWNINGQVRYTYFHTSGQSSLDGNTGIELGYETICDSSLNILDSVKLYSYTDINASVQDKLDVHEFILLGDNHYICDTYYEESPNNIPDSLKPAKNVKVAACIIQEVDNGEVVFQWNGTQYPELYASSAENNDFSDSVDLLDYMHLNSICVDSLDNNLIVSFRNLNEIVKINRQTGQIMWRLGGKNSDFSQTQDEMFLRQHYARLIENGQTLIFLDNGDETLRAFSRILEFQLDENAKTITSFKAFTVPDKFIQFAGSVKKEGDNYFIGGGEGNYSLEVNYNTNEILFRLNLNYPSYRSLKY
jgi:arylsulfate sulfotransferase